MDGASQPKQHRNGNQGSNGAANTGSRGFSINQLIHHDEPDEQMGHNHEVQYSASAHQTNTQQADGVMLCEDQHSNLDSLASIAVQMPYLTTPLRTIYRSSLPMIDFADQIVKYYDQYVNRFKATRICNGFADELWEEIEELFVSPEAQLPASAKVNLERLQAFASLLRDIAQDPGRTRERLCAFASCVESLIEIIVSGGRPGETSPRSSSTVSG